LLLALEPVQVQAIARAVVRHSLLASESAQAIARAVVRHSLLLAATQQQLKEEEAMATAREALEVAMLDDQEEEEAKATAREALELAMLDDKDADAAGPKDEQAAATKIQAVHRGHIARRQLATDGAQEAGAGRGAAVDEASTAEPGKVDEEGSRENLGDTTMALTEMVRSEARERLLQSVANGGLLEALMAAEDGTAVGSALPGGEAQTAAVSLEEASAIETAASRSYCADLVQRCASRPSSSSPRSRVF
jgi:hypothetical protein